MKPILRFCLLTLALGLAQPLCGQDLVIIHTNDFHSQMAPQTTPRNYGRGGIEALSGCIQEVRDQHPYVLYLDAGDYNQGTPYFNLFKGEMEIQLMNALGLDAAALGNHEFDNGIADLAWRLKMAHHVTLCANYTIKNKELAKLVKPYAIFKINGHKIGVIGLTRDLRTFITAGAYKELVYHNEAEVANKYAKKLRRKGCDLIIALTHMGYEEDQKLVAQTRNIDLVIGGHSHTFLEEVPTLATNLDGKEVPVVTTGCWGLNVGKIEVNF